jgi:hypothetical protein
MTAPRHMHRLVRAKTNRKNALFNLGPLSPNPWDLSLSRQNDSLPGRLTPPRHSGRWVGAPVASLRCRILLPGEVSINRAAHGEKIQIKKNLPESAYVV